MKTKRILLNLITDVLPMIIISVLGIFKFKLFIDVLGTDIQGMYQLFTQVMFYVSIVDGGLGSAVLYALYEPNASGQKEKMNAILAGAMRVFSLMGIVVYGLAFIVSFFVPLFIKDNPFEYTYVVVAFLLFATSSVIGYFFVPHQSLLEVKECRYVYNTIFQVGQICQSVIEIIMLLCNMNFFLILLMHSLIKVISYSILAWRSRKMFPEYNYCSEHKDYGFVHQVKHLIFHKINGLVGSNIDVLIITRFLGLTAVSIYSTYNYIINMMKQILEKLYSSMLAIIGNILSKDKSYAFALFKELNSLMFYLATVVCVPLLLAIDSFITIWYEGKISTDFRIALAFTGILFLAIVKIATTVFVSAGGLFEETKICAATDTVINLVLSLTLVHWLGISGVLFATFFSVFVAEYIMKTIVIHKELFGCSSRWFFLKNVKFFLLVFIDFVIGFYVSQYFVVSNIFNWFLSFTIYTILNGLVVLGIYMFMKEADFMNRVKNVVKRGG